MTTKTISIVVIEDHPVFRNGLIRSLSVCDEVNIVGKAGSGEDGLAEITEKKPNVALLDFHMPRGPGPDKLEMIEQAMTVNSKTKLIIITGENNPYLLSLMLYVGGNSLILKNDVKEISYVLEVIKSTNEGKYRLTKVEELNYQINEAGNEQREFIATMNDTELDTIFMFSEGYSYEEIAKYLKKSTDYIPHILRRAREKSGLENNNELKALYQKLFPLGYSAKKFKTKNIKQRSKNLKRKNEKS